MFRKQWIAAILAIFISITVCYGQTGQTGKIYGTVTDPDGVPLPGITVTVKSPSIVMKELQTVSNMKGVYRFVSLSPGSYELSFVMEGMKKIIRKGIVVNAGKTATVDVSMSFSEIMETVTVKGQAPTIDRQSTSTTVSMDIEFLKSVPGERDLGAYFNMAPGITADTAHGSATTENTYNLDGVNVGDPANGRQLASYSLEIMEEISVKSGSLSAEYGNVKGAAINVVTKSGGNKFSGSAYVHYDHESFQSDNTKGTPLYDPDNTTKTGTKHRYEPGFTLGGPVIKDKLWFFANLNYLKYSQYVTGFPYDKADGEPDLPYEDSTVLGYLKFTYQPSQDDKFVLSYNVNSWSTDVHGASRYETLATTRTAEEELHMFNAHWTKNIGTNFYGNLKMAYINQSRLAYAKGDQASFTNVVTGESWGSHWRNTDGTKSKKLQINLDSTTFIDDFFGSHELKIGGEAMLSRFNWMVWANVDPVSGCSIINMRPDANGDLVYYWGFTVKGFDKITDTHYFSAFVNDTWSITNNLTLSLGLRYEDASIIFPVQGDQGEKPIDLGWTVVDRVVRERNTASTWRTLSPRIGLIYDIFADGSTLAKLSWSRYSQPALTQFVNLSHPNGWIVSRTMLNPDGSIAADYPFMTPSASHVGYKDHELKAAHMDEFIVSIERELWEDWSMGARFIKKWDRDLLHKVDGARIDMETLLEKGELNWIGYEEITVTDPYTGEDITFYNDTDPGRAPEEYLVNVDLGKRDYDGLEISLNKRFSHGWSMNFSYVWANSRGLFPTTGNGPMGVTDMFINPNAHINAEGRFPAERRHQLKLNALVRGPWGINVGTYMRLLSGRRYTRTVSSDLLGVQLAPSPRTIYAESLGSQGYDSLFLVDLRFEKELKVFKNIRLKLFADIFNLFNDNTVTSVYNNSSNPEIEFGKVYGILSPRLMRLGFKVEF